PYKPFAHHPKRLLSPPRLLLLQPPLAKFPPLLTRHLSRIHIGIRLPHLLQTPPHYRPYRCLPHNCPRFSTPSTKISSHPPCHPLSRFPINQCSTCMREKNRTEGVVSSLR